MFYNSGLCPSKGSTMFEPFLYILCINIEYRIYIYITSPYFLCIVVFEHKAVSLAISLVRYNICICICCKYIYKMIITTGITYPHRVYRA